MLQPGVILKPLNVDSGRLVSRCSASDSVLHIVISQEVQSEAPEEGANTSGPNPAVAIAEDEHEAKTRNETNYDIKI